MHTKAQRGFTMMELIVVISIVGILMAIGAPSYKYITTANRVSSEVNGLLGDMQFARAEAIKEGQTVTVCATADGATCTGNSTWTGGWLVFMDGTTIRTFDGTDVLLRVQKPLSGGDRFSADNNIGALTFNREGFASGLPGTVTLTLQDSTLTTAYTRCLAISIVGAMTTQTHGTGNCP
jgi:type IV fimbrial biogenesis protein FimT